MPVIRRKLASTPISTPRVARRTPVAVDIPRPYTPTQTVTNERGLDFRASAKYLGTSVWEIRRLARTGILKPYRLGQKTQYIDRLDLDELIERSKH